MNLTKANRCWKVEKYDLKAVFNLWRRMWREIIEGGFVHGLMTKGVSEGQIQGPVGAGLEVDDALA